MYIKSCGNHYTAGDVYIIKDRKPTDGTSGNHPYLVISIDDHDSILTLPISSAYSEYVPIYTYTKDGDPCYTYLNPFRIYPQSSKYMNMNAQFAFRVSNEYLDFVVGLFMSRLLKDYEAQSRIENFRKEFFETYPNLPQYHLICDKPISNIIKHETPVIDKEPKNITSEPIKPKTHVSKAPTEVYVGIFKSSELYKAINIDELFHKKLADYSKCEVDAFRYAFENYGAKVASVAFNISYSCAFVRYKALCKL